MGPGTRHCRQNGDDDADARAESGNRTLDTVKAIDYCRMGAVCSCFQKKEPENGTATAATSTKRAATAKSDTGDETKRRESVFYDALQSATESMQYVPPSIPNYLPRGSVAMDDPDSLLRSRPATQKLRQTLMIKEHLDEPSVRVELRGYPGDLTQEELDTCLAFRKAIKEKEDPSYKEMVEQFKQVEEEPYALCRFLRGKNFDLDEALANMDANIETWKDGKPHDFYPSIEGAVGCPAPVYLSLFPYFYSGVARNGCPVAFLKAGALSVEGVECVTDLDCVAKYMWNAFRYQFEREVARAQKDDPTAVRCESVTVIDLKGLDTSQLNKKTLGALSSVVTIGCCFPELLNQMIILNTPFAFSMFWSLIKQFLEPRTVAKIEIFTNEKKGKERLLKMIDQKELLADYGGGGPSYDQLAHDAMGENKSGSTRQAAELLSPNKVKDVATLVANEQATVRVYTRSTSGATVTLTKDGSEVATVQLKSTGDDSSYCTDIVSNEKGPGKLQVKIHSSTKTDLFLVHVDVFSS